MFHQVTGYRFFNKNDRRYVIYTTMYTHGKYGSIHECTGLTDEEAKYRFFTEHYEEVDYHLRAKNGLIQRQAIQLKEQEN